MKHVMVMALEGHACSDEGLTLETSAHNHFHGVKLIHINLKLIHYTFLEGQFD